MTTFILLAVLILVVVFMFYTLYTILSPNRVVPVSTRTKLVLLILDEIMETYREDLTQMTFLEIGAAYGKVAGYAARKKSLKK